MRDFFKSEEYWEAHVFKLEQDISQMDELIAAGEIPMSNLEQTVKFVEYERLCLSLAMYSAGRDIGLCRAQFIRSLNNLSKLRQKLESYVDVIWYISLCVLFGIENDVLDKLDSIVPDNFLSDKIAAFLMNYLDNGARKGETFAMSEPYSRLGDALDPRCSRTAEVIRTYLTKYWYKGHDEEPWYDSHNDGELYFGYWSLESGAIAKILKIDDDALKDVRYYPYDLVHYRS